MSICKSSRKEFTSVSKARALALVMGPCGIGCVDVESMGMMEGCSASEGEGAKLTNISSNTLLTLNMVLGTVYMGLGR